MKLRTRLLLASVAVALPVVAAMAYQRREALLTAASDSVSDITTTRMLSGGRDRCEASPESWNGKWFGRRRPPNWQGHEPPPPDDGPHDERPPYPPPPPPPPGPPLGGPHPGAPPGPIAMYPYDAELKPSQSAAPALDRELLRGMEEGQDAIASTWEQDGVPMIDVLVRMPWTEGPCAFILARRPLSPPGMTAPVGPPVIVWLLPALAVLGVVLLALGPVVGRIRRLVDAMREAARGRYEKPVLVEGNDEVAAVARAFNEAGSDVRAHIVHLEDRDRTLRAFLANTTHDVMTPLTVLQGHLSTLRRSAAKGEPADPSVVKEAAEEAHYMASLLHNLALAAKIEAGEPKASAEPVDLGLVVERAVSRHRPIAEQRQVSLDSAVPDERLVVSGDVTLIEQAVSNIVQNAVRYNESGGHVAVVLEPTTEGFSLRVLDDGPGIPDDEISRILERNFRGREARTRSPSGHGLGLHIASSVAAMHGFELSLTRPEGGGLSVEISGKRSAAPPVSSDADHTL